MTWGSDGPEPSWDAFDVLLPVMILLLVFGIPMLALCTEVAR